MKAKKKVLLLLDAESLARLDRRVKKEKATRLSLIRKAVSTYLNDADERDAIYSRG